MASFHQEWTRLAEAEAARLQREADERTAQLAESQRLAERQAKAKALGEQQEREEQRRQSVEGERLQRRQRQWDELRWILAEAPGAIAKGIAGLACAALCIALSVGTVSILGLNGIAAIVVGVILVVVYFMLLPWILGTAAILAVVGGIIWLIYAIIRCLFF